MDITKMNVVELKALMFDLGQENNRLQNNIQVVLTELKKRIDKTNAVKPVDEVKAVKPKVVK